MTLTPYLHDGSAPTPEAAIAAHFPPAAQPPPDEMSALIAFLGALTDTRFTSDPPKP